MAYVIVTASGEELDRRKLSRCTIIGRSPECDIPIRDILLSRRHCRIKQTLGGWVLTDLQSKNGTCLAREKIVRHAIEDGDIIKIGRTTVSFHTGPFVPAPPGTPTPKVVRPTDPNESLQSTVAGFALKEEEEREDGGTSTPPQAAMPMVKFDLSDHHPRPHPGPPVPRSYLTEGVHEMLQEMASDMWDSVVTTSPRPKATTSKLLPKPMPRPKGPADPCTAAVDDIGLSLQVGADTLDEVKPPRQVTTRPRVRPTFLVTVVIVVIVALAVLLGGYLLTLR